MAIVKMKKLRVMALAECREDLLGGLQHLGCVEISEPNLSDPAWSALLRRGSSSLAQTRTEIADAHTALAAIKQYAKVKDGLFIQRRQVSEQEFLDPTGKEQAKAVSQKIGGALREISRLQGDEARLTARAAGPDTLGFAGYAAGVGGNGSCPVSADGLPQWNGHRRGADRAGRCCGRTL